MKKTNRLRKLSILCLVPIWVSSCATMDKDKQPDRPGEGPIRSEPASPPADPSMLKMQTAPMGKSAKTDKAARPASSEPPKKLVPKGPGKGVSSMNKQELLEEVDRLTGTVSRLTDQVNHMQTENHSMKMKLKGSQNKLNNLNQQKNASFAPIPTHPADQGGTRVKPAISRKDPRAGFSQGEPIRKYREARVYFDSGNYSQAILSFAAFIKNFADHALAGAAQFHVGMAYYHRKEYKLAIDEFSKILISYDRNNYVPDALLHIALCYDLLEKPKEASKNRELLQRLFPQSPAAGMAKTGKRRSTAMVDDGTPPTAPVPSGM